MNQNSEIQQLIDLGAKSSNEAFTGLVSANKAEALVKGAGGLIASNSTPPPPPQQTQPEGSNSKEQQE
jgi:hypothetical protein